MTTTQDYGIEASELQGPFLSAKLKALGFTRTHVTLTQA